MENYVLLFPLLFFMLSCQQRVDQAFEAAKPNILLIVADDLGYSDLAAYGGEIPTPNLDTLVARGLTFRQFHTAPMCAVTRAMLLTGNDHHIAGMGSQSLETSHFGYEGYLTDRVTPFPQLLLEAGYHTSMAGKWHLGFSREQYPDTKGFEQSYGVLEGGANHYSNKGVFKEYPISVYVENGKKVTWNEGDYSTDFYTEKLISYIDKYRSDPDPFFAFAAYTSPHWPLQVDSAYWMKYQGMYDAGYEVLKNVRFANQKKLGIIPEDAALPAPHPDVVPWDSLSEEQQKIEARKMELYAGMVDNLDVNIGRLIDYLKATEQYDNTLIIFFSDNGAAAADFYTHPHFKEFLQENYTDAYEEMGTKDSFVAYGAGWAQAGASPFRYYKRYTTQGGINMPMIMAGPGVERKGEVTNAFTTVMDLAPTFYELAGTRYPKANDPKPVYPLKGASMRAFIEGTNEMIHPPDYVFAMEHRGNVMVRKGDWKLLNITKPYDEENFELYDLSNDLGEQNDLKAEFPDVYDELMAEWEKYRKETKVQFPTPESGS